MKNFGFLLLLTLLTACSKPAKEEMRIELQVDGKSVLKEQATDANIGALYQRHLEVMTVVEQACQLAKFLGETRSQKTGSQTVTSRTSTSNNSLGDGASTEFTSVAQAAIQNFQIPGQTIRCTTGLPGEAVEKSEISGFAGCSMRPSQGQSAQTQYLVLLKNWMQDKHAMRTQASWHSESVQREGQFERRIQTDVLMTPSQLKCVENLLEK